MIKGRSSRVHRKEFPHLKEWYGKYFWAPSSYHGSVGAGWDVVEKYISATIHTRIIGDNPEKTLYTGLGHLSEVYRDFSGANSAHPSSNGRLGSINKINKFEIL